jgi:hypothetical protein
VKRTIEEAVEIAKRNGVEIPEDVEFFEAEPGIPFRIHPDVLTSDEAVVGVFQHEIYELSLIRQVFIQSEDGSMDGTDYGIQTSTGRPGNFHDLAWDEADGTVLRMRRRTK